MSVRTVIIGSALALTVTTASAAESQFGKQLAAGLQGPHRTRSSLRAPCGAVSLLCNDQGVDVGFNGVELQGQNKRGGPRSAMHRYPGWRLGRAGSTCRHPLHRSAPADDARGVHTPGLYGAEQRVAVPQVRVM